MIRVGLVEDHPLYREALATSLPASRFEIVFSVSTICDAERVLRIEGVDIVLVDVRLPDGDGLTLPGRTSDNAHRCPVFVAVTSFADPVMVERARMSGFRGFVSKATDRLSLVDVIERCHAGEEIFPRPRHHETAGSHLSDRELEVLALVAEGLTNADVGEALGISRETVKSHLAQVLRKLDAVDRVNAVARAYRMGLLARDPPSGG